MIMRSWNAVATEAGSRAFARYFTTRALPRLRDVDGFLGAYLLDRDGDDLVSLTVLTLWESEEALAAHTGIDPHVAIMEPESIAALLDFDSEVTHHHVAMQPGAATAPATAPAPAPAPAPDDEPRHRAPIHQPESSRAPALS